jgi:hypothetical protein
VTVRHEAATRSVPDVAAAEDFILRSARLIDRHRFAVLFRRGDPSAVLSALLPYQNADGGFGHALEPDLRGPESEPVPTWTALMILDEIDRFDDPIVSRACDFLVSITTSEGGVPFVLPAAHASPHAPWWETGPTPPASVNPTAAIAALLHKHRVAHRWLKPATVFTWRAIELAAETSPYDAGAVIAFLDWVPDRERAKSAFDRFGRLLLEGDHVALDPDAAGEVHYPLDFARRPDGLARALFDDEVIDRHLDALVARQESDGGWPINFLVWTPVTGLEWRSWQTIDVLKMLRAYGRLDEQSPGPLRRAADQ